MPGTITVIEGASGTGKTNLVEGLRPYGYTVKRGTISQDEKRNAELIHTSQRFIAKILGRGTVQFADFWNPRKRTNAFICIFGVGMLELNDAMQRKERGEDVVFERSGLSGINWLGMADTFQPGEIHRRAYTRPLEASKDYTTDEWVPYSRWARRLHKTAKDLLPVLAGNIDAIVLMEKGFIERGGGRVEREGGADLPTLTVEEDGINRIVRRFAQQSGKPFRAFDVNDFRDTKMAEVDHVRSFIEEVKVRRPTL